MSFPSFALVTVTPLVLVGLLQAAAAQELKLKRVMLSSGGVGYFEHEATVDGDVELPLTVRRDMVDDILKSLVVYDDRGAVGQVSLAGAESGDEIFRELPFDRAALDHPATLLSALKGAEVRLAGQAALEGRIVAASVEPGTEQLPQAVALTLLTADGLRTVRLRDLDSVAFRDQKLAGLIGAALAQLHEQSYRERRTLRIVARGAGRRMVRVAFVAGAPLWKATYRLTLDVANTTGKGDLQGWAILENRSGQDWTGVELTLVSGSPVTFRQQLHAAYYVDRPNLPVEVIGRILPPVDAGGIAPVEAAKTLPPPAPGGARADGAAPFMAQRSLALPQAPPAAPPPAAEPIVGSEMQSDTQVRFRLAQPVTLKDGASLMAPIVARETGAERLAFYQPQVHRLFPLSAVRLANDGPSALPPGIVTLYERDRETVSFVGDARLGPLPQNERRLLSFALDTRIRIEASTKSAERLTRLKVADSLLEAVQTESQTTSYAIVAPEGLKRTLIVEQPRPGPDWTVVRPAAGVELADGRFRVAQPLPSPSGTVEVTVERPLSRTLRLDTLPAEQIAAYASATELTAEQRDSFRKLTELSRAAAEADQRLRAVEQEVQALKSDQERLRGNLGAVPAGSDLQKRYLAQLAEQEDRFARLSGQIGEARQKRDVARAALAGFVRELKL